MRTNPKLFDALKRITQYQTLAQLRRSADRDYGVDYVDALERAYENIIQEAKIAVRGKKRPSPPSQGRSAESVKE